MTRRHKYNQDEVNIEYLNHAVRNGVAKIAGCFREVEQILAGMNDAVRGYAEITGNTTPRPGVQPGPDETED